MKTFSNVVGTIGYSAPEVLSGLGYTDKSDIWSVGMILFEIFHRVINGFYQRPYEEYGHLADYLVVAKVVESNLTPSVPSPSPEELKNLILQCWSKEPNKRPDIFEIENILLSLHNQYNPEWESKYSQVNKLP